MADSRASAIGAGVHPSEKNGRHEFYLMCDDIEVFRAEMSSKHVACAEIREERWGRLVEIAFPGGGHLGVYQPLHARPESIQFYPALQ